MSEEQVHAIECWEQKIFDRAAQADELQAAALIPREEAMRAWLDALGCPESWEIAAQLAEESVTIVDLEKLTTFLGGPEACVLL